MTESLKKKKIRKSAQFKRKQAKHTTVHTKTSCSASTITLFGLGGFCC